MLLIEHIELEFDNGLNVLTGETGAGKSILLDCLGFVLGRRGKADLVRQGASQGEVEAEFDISQSPRAAEILSGAGIDIEDDHLLIRRMNARDGRKRAFVNDRSVSGDLLRQLGECLIEFHGQHDSKGLLDERTHLAHFDLFSDVDLASMKKAYQAYKQAQRDLDSAVSKHEKSESEHEFLTAAIAELLELAPKSDEELSLVEKRRLMKKGQELRDEFGNLLSLLGDEGLGSKLRDTFSAMKNLCDKLGEEGGEILTSFSTGYDEIARAEQILSDLSHDLEFDPVALELLEDRLFALRAAARKYGVSVDMLAVKLNEFQNELNLFEGGDEQINALTKLRDEAKVHAEKLAREISQKRWESKTKLEDMMHSELAPLKMKEAKFTVEISASELTESGHDKVNFVVQTNPGAPAGNLSKIASGGELSRFLLAMKICIKQQNAKTMIFDEIDQGVGGQTADAVGRRLYKLAETEQLIVVTHSPQVAAFGVGHYRVSKEQRQEHSLTDVLPLNRDEKQTEIARMISGDKITEEALAAAQKLIESVGAS